MLSKVPRVFTVRFSDIERWDPQSFHHIEWHWDEIYMQPIGSFLSPRKEKVERSQFKFAELQPITIHFDGSIEPREVREGQEYSMDLFFCHSGDVVVSKIDLKNGAVGVIPSDLENVIVTNHFAVYEPNLLKVIPEYFCRIIQARFFRSHLWRNKVGTEGRKEVKLDFFESLLVPLPNLEIQRAILGVWERGLEEINVIRTQIEHADQATFETILEAVGLGIPKLEKRNRAFMLAWNTFQYDRWSVNFNRWKWKPDNLFSSTKYKMEKLSVVCSINPARDFMFEVEEETPVTFVPMESVSDITGTIITPQVRPYDEVKQGYTFFRDGDILWAKITPCMQNGKCAVE